MIQYKPSVYNIDKVPELGEGQFIEFKESFDKSIQKEIVAFANASGGVIYLGITDAFWITIGSNHDNNIAEKVVEKVAEKVVEKVVENLTANQKTIIKLINENHHISARELAIEVEISHRKTQENIAKQYLTGNDRTVAYRVKF